MQKAASPEPLDKIVTLELKDIRTSSTLGWKLGTRVAGVSEGSLAGVWYTGNMSSRFHTPQPKRNRVCILIPT